jgi:hypothetical protein
MLQILRFVPLLSFPVVAYVLIALIDGSGTGALLLNPIWSLKMMSGDSLSLSLGDIIVIIGLFCFAGELLRSSTPTRKVIGANMIGIIIFTVCFVLFLIVKGFATTPFLILNLMLLLDFIVDSAVLVYVSRRTIEFDRH